MVGGGIVAVMSAFFLLTFHSQRLPVFAFYEPIILFSFVLSCGVFALIAGLTEAGLAGANRTAWFAAMWAFRFTALVDAIFFLRNYDRLTIVEWAVAGGLFLVLLVGQAFAHDQDLGWIIDDRGERQRVTGMNRGYAIFTPTTHKERVIQEAAEKSERRRNLAISGVCGAPLAYGTFHFAHTGTLVYAIILGWFAIIAAVWFVPNLIYELLYQVGFQDIDGAKVLDPAPKRPGAEQVSAQKAHGDATVASEHEARDFLKTRR